jgi:hypothetical protein
MMNLTRQQAIDAAKQAVDERDTMQANLLDLDGSFGKRLLAGAQLTGISQQRWGTASAALAQLWDMFSTYSGVVDRAAGLAGGRLGTKELAEISQLLTGPSVEIIRAPGPRRDLGDSGIDRLTLSTARARMREPYQQVTDVVTAAETNWNAVAASLDTAAQALGQVDALGDPVLGSEVAAVQAELTRQRNALNADPLGTEAAAADRLAGRARAAGEKSARLAGVRDGARQRITALRAVVDAARAAYAQADVAYQQACARIAGVPPIGVFADPSPRLAALDPLLAAGNWPALAAALDELERDTQAVLNKNLESQRAVVSLVSQRDELRGLLDAYRAKAGRLGAAEDPGLARLYAEVRELLWSAPCDLRVASAAVTSYQQAVLAIGAR